MYTRTFIHIVKVYYTIPSYCCQAPFRAFVRIFGYFSYEPAQAASCIFKPFRRQKCPNMADTGNGASFSSLCGLRKEAPFCIIIRFPRPTWSLTPHSPAGAFAPKALTPPHYWRSRRRQKPRRQDLPLSRTMLTGIFPAYVDRFACDWHRLSTTDARKPRIHYRRFGVRSQAEIRSNPFQHTHRNLCACARRHQARPACPPAPRGRPSGNRRSRPPACARTRGRSPSA